MRGRQFSTSFWAQFFRNTGLGLFNDFSAWFQKYRHRENRLRDEEKKIVVSSSRRLALSRCGIHILPILVSIAIIAINSKQDFIGIDFHSRIPYQTMNIALLQTAAKLQELLIVASLATVVFQLTRDELLYGDGLPLGLVSAGIDFSKLNFFWSRELSGSLRFLLGGGWRSLFQGPRWYRRRQLAVFLLLAGVLSLLAGPSCAVLLVPQLQGWPVGGTPIALNGTADDFWPVKVSMDPLQSSICSNLNGTLSGVCPSGGYESLWSHYYNLDNSSYRGYVRNYAYQVSGNHYYWSTGSISPILTRTISLGWPLPTVWMMQPHLSASIVLDQLMIDWWSAAWASGSYSDSEVNDRYAQSSLVLNPLARVGCGRAELLSSSNDTIEFPYGDSQSSNQNFQSTKISNTTVPLKQASHLQFSWFPLPESFGSVTTGAVLQSAWDSNNKSRLVVGCSISAHWVYSYLESNSYTFWQGWYPKSIRWGYQYPSNGYQFLNGSASTQDAVLVDQSWLNALTPTTPVSGPGHLDWKSTTIESILSSVRITEDIQRNGKIFVDEWQNQNNTNRPGLLCSVIASFIVDGLSRTGVTRLFKAQGNPSQWTLSPYEKKIDFDRMILEGKRALNYPEANDMFSVDFGISGLSYQTSTAQQLAMVVLLLHMAIASIHIVWTITRGKSSASWDSVTEIMVLAQNSKPAMKALQNTAAGIQRSATFSKNVVIRTTELHDTQEADHLEFLLTEEAADAGGEMVDLPPQNPGLSQSGQSPVAQADQQRLETADLLPPPTLPQNPGLSQSEQSSVAQADQQRLETANLVPPPTVPIHRPPPRLQRTLWSLFPWSRKSARVRNPRVAPSSPDSRAASDNRFVEDYAYR